MPCSVQTTGQLGLFLCLLGKQQPVCECERCFKCISHPQLNRPEQLQEEESDMLIGQKGNRLQ